MNKKQKAIIICGIVAIIIMFTFPPYAGTINGSKLSTGYHITLFGRDKENRCPIDIGMLSIQYVTVFIVGGLLWLLVKDTKSKDNLKGDQEKTK
ncbi:MAG: hypothetical protein HW406_555 [Candidatus Brocadiaceae bacterium]|nr:hypothetical protein [Candidatus Brocadiaceae bacterium]